MIFLFNFHAFRAVVNCTEEFGQGEEGGWAGPCSDLPPTTFTLGRDEAVVLGEGRDDHREAHGTSEGQCIFKLY